MPGTFGAVATAMATPFKEDGSLDVDGAQALASHLIDNGTQTIVAAGTTGESPTLTHAEKEDLFRAVADVVRGRAKMVCGTGTNSTADSIELTEMATEAGADGVLLVTPYYNKPPQRALAQHFRTVAAATDRPVILYNIPSRTGTRIEYATLVELAAVSNIVAVKDSTGDLDAVSKLIAETDYEVYCGDDWATFAFVCLGAKGIVSVASHMVGSQISEMVSKVEAGDIDSARKIHQQLSPLFAALFCTTSPIPLKAALRMLGLPGGPLRAPLYEATDAERERVREALVDVGCL
jgi:4-hydroxy-tetrahydrodipicolinate synthase